MNLRVREAEDWADVEVGTKAAKTCIAPGNSNNRRAQESFEMGGIRYFLQGARIDQGFSYARG